ncbi:MAG: nucleotide exchange factor GrpE [Patescibacteria group bacterium]|nr:nucleotide exchange factor GrpE [Patescibacteria group bacterium]MCL5258031.1 nucleotide exchange factor GrpE [Patescibacteria group bacterium]
MTNLDESQNEQNQNEAEEKLPTESETIRELSEQIKQLEQEKIEYFNGLQRAKADLLRAKKEMEIEAKEFQFRANEILVHDLVPVLDSFDLAIGSLTEADKEKQLGKGYYLIQAQLFDILKRCGFESVEIGQEKFDPNFHEAISTKTCDKKDCSGDDDGLITEVFSRGYRFQGRIIRPAKVKVIVHPDQIKSKSNLI